MRYNRSRRLIKIGVMVTTASLLYQFCYTELHPHQSKTNARQVPILWSPYNAKSHLAPERNLTNRFIIYRCQKGLCGGLADRQKGIVSSYIMSQMLKRKFGIIMNKGCNLTDFLIPNQVDWMVSEESIRGLNKTTVRIIDWPVGKFFENNHTLESIFSEKVVYYEGNINYVNKLMKNALLSNVKWARNNTASEIYQIAFSQLFRFSSRTSKRYEEFKVKTENRSLLCAHFRMGRSINNPRDSRSPKRSPNVTKVIEQLQTEINRNSVVFVATDSVSTREELMKAFPRHYVDLPGAILHVDRAGKTFDCSGMEKAILDQYILTTCKTLIISNSGFSFVAALLRGTVEGLYQALPTSVQAIKSLG